MLRFPNIWNVRFAIQGIWTALKEEKQVFWGLIILCMMLGIAIWQEVGVGEFAVLLVLGSIILALEMFNGAIERLCNKVQPNHDPDIKKIKDLTSGAVLLLSLVMLGIWTLLVFF